MKRLLPIVLTLAVLLLPTAEGWSADVNKVMRRDKTQDLRPSSTQDLSIEKTEFFIELYDGSGDSVIVENNLVPLIPGQICYGWRIRVVGTIGLVKFKEIFTLPIAPDFWGGENNEFATNKIVKHRRTSITERFAVPDKGWITNGWCVAEGDPEGKYSMKVYLNDQFIKRFEFEVKKVN